MCVDYNFATFQSRFWVIIISNFWKLLQQVVYPQRNGQTQFFKKHLGRER